MKNFNPRFKWCVTRLIWQHAPAGWQFDELSMFHRDKKSSSHYFRADASQIANYELTFGRGPAV
jgi:hypothetical protein